MNSIGLIFVASIVPHHKTLLDNLIEFELCRLYTECISETGKLDSYVPLIVQISTDRNVHKV